MTKLKKLSEKIREESIFRSFLTIQDSKEDWSLLNEKVKSDIDN